MDAQTYRRLEAAAGRWLDGNTQDAPGWAASLFEKWSNADGSKADVAALSAVLEARWHVIWSNPTREAVETFVQQCNMAPAISDLVAERRETAVAALSLLHYSRREDGSVRGPYSVALARGNSQAWDMAAEIIAHEFSFEELLKLLPEWGEVHVGPYGPGGVMNGGVEDIVYHSPDGKALMERLSDSVIGYMAIIGCGHQIMAEAARRGLSLPLPPRRAERYAEMVQDAADDAAWPEWRKNTSPRLAGYWAVLRPEWAEIAQRRCRQETEIDGWGDERDVTEAQWQLGVEQAHKQMLSA